MSTTNQAILDAIKQIKAAIKDQDDQNEWFFDEIFGFYRLGKIDFWQFHLVTSKPQQLIQADYLGLVNWYWEQMEWLNSNQFNPDWLESNWLGLLHCDYYHLRINAPAKHRGKKQWDLTYDFNLSPLKLNNYQQSEILFAPIQQVQSELNKVFNKVKTSVFEKCAQLALVKAKRREKTILKQWINDHPRGQSRCYIKIYFQPNGQIECKFEWPLAKNGYRGNSLYTIMQFSQWEEFSTHWLQICDQSNPLKLIQAFKVLWKSYQSLINNC